MSKYLNAEEQKESENGLRRLLQYIVDNPLDWEAITDMESCGVNAKQRLEIMERLEDAGLLSVAYVVLYLVGDKSREMELIRNRISGELVLNVPSKNLMALIKEALSINKNI